MTSGTLQRHQAIEWSVASRALPGQSVSGDLYVVAPVADGFVIGVVDGLGHGEAATLAAQQAVRTIEQQANAPVVGIVQHCHRALQQTRGVAMTVVKVNERDDTLTALGIGNVETAIVHANPRMKPNRESVLLRCGVVGYQLPAMQPSVHALASGDVIVFATDGVRDDFSALIVPADSASRIAERIMAQKFRGTDDGLVLACKYLGRA